MARPMNLDAAAFADRLVRAQDGVRTNGAAALLIGLGADLRYLTGYSAHALERLTMLVVPYRGTPTLIVPRLEAMAASASAVGAAGLVQVVAWDETDDPYALAAGHAAAAGRSTRLLVDPGLPARHLLALQEALPERAFGLATEVTRGLRIVKDGSEIELLRAAAHAADRVVEQIATGPLIGRSEAEVSREVRDRLVAEGHEAASFAIVASGPNGASPHHDASDRIIQAGDPIVLDIGGTVSGYGSDITRMVWVTGGDAEKAPSAEFLAVFDLVRTAQAAATNAVRPGVTGGALDEVARRVIRDGGHGEAFIHRLGHGIGLEAHEEPYLVAGNAEALSAGHAFSIEPGVYLPGRFGVRIEDIVICTEDGADVLNEAPHELRVVDG